VGPETIVGTALTELIVGNILGIKLGILDDDMVGEEVIDGAGVGDTVGLGGGPEGA